LNDLEGGGQRSGLAAGRRSSLSFRPSRTTNIFLFIGEANRVQACGKPHVLVAQLTLCS